MADILDYIRWRGDLSFKKVPFCELDALVLSLLSYMELDGIADGEKPSRAKTFSEVTALYFEKYGDKVPPRGLLMPDEFPEFFRLAAGSERYGNMRIFAYKSVYSEESETQFAAVSMILPDGSMFISYRGTDDTLAGWKENFNQSHIEVIGAQYHALEYFTSVSRTYRGKIRIGGHSKGGNLSMYAAINAPWRVARRIEKVYNFDGPGFASSPSGMAGYAGVKDRIITVLPEFSVVGLLLENGKIDQVVKSNAHNLWQHDPFSWEVEPYGFALANRLSEECLHVERTVKHWLSGLDGGERKGFFDAIFKVLSSNGAKTLSDISDNKMEFVRSLAKVEPSVRNVIISTGKLLLMEGINTVHESRKRKKTEDKG